ncbi:MAG: sigma-54 interaction domain-containing protein [Candidatus Acidiferrales bacterium]
MNTPAVDWIAEDPASVRLLSTAKKVADTSTTVLITGETGTGKDQLARWIHDHGPRHDAPFLKIDCASLPPELVESELFGHEKGAFTGAEARKPGRLELARDGTTVLDEVAALASGVQAKLLRVLEERRFERLGGAETLRMNSRVMALTNSDLQRAVANGSFREDLFFRLNVLVLRVPPLRVRRGDIRPLAAYLLERMSRIHGRKGLSLDEEAFARLESFDWPGNVRELKNSIEHAVLLSEDRTLRAADFPSLPAARPESARGAHLPSLAEIERRAIAETLEATHYKISRAAEILGISRKTLLEKRKKYGLH